jgi:hypothetical protein
MTTANEVIEMVESDSKTFVSLDKKMGQYLKKFGFKINPKSDPIHTDEGIDFILLSTLDVDSIQEVDDLFAKFKKDIPSGWIKQRSGRSSFGWTSIHFRTKEGNKEYEYGWADHHYIDLDYSGKQIKVYSTTGVMHKIDY